MRVRITKTLVALVVGALLITSLGSLVLINRAARHDTETELAEQADRIAALGESEGLNFIRNAAKILDLADAKILVIGSSGAINSIAADGTAQKGADLPNGLTLDDLALEELTQGVAVSSSRRDIAFAAAPITDLVTRSQQSANTTSTSLRRITRNGQLKQQLRQKIQESLPDVNSKNRLAVVVLTRNIDTGLGAAAPYILLSAGIAFILALAFGDRLARRISMPIHQARLTTSSIARGEFDQRLNIPNGSDAEIRELADSINQMADALESGRDAQRHFLMSISHELRTPLTSIRGYAEAIGDGAAPDPKAAAEIINQEAQRLARLVQDLLDLSKLESDQFTLKLSRCNVSDVLEQTVAALTPTATKFGLKISVEPSDVSVEVNADADRLQQCLSNIIENGLKYARHAVLIRSSTTNNWLQISVIDDGEGMPEADVANVFERHFTSRPSSRAVSTGLGLAIVKQLVEAMGGRVTAQNSARAGAEVIIQLPVG